MDTTDGGNPRGSRRFQTLADSASTKIKSPISPAVTRPTVLKTLPPSPKENLKQTLKSIAPLKGLDSVPIKALPIPPSAAAKPISAAIQPSVERPAVKASAYLQSPVSTSILSVSPRQSWESQILEATRTGTSVEPEVQFPYNHFLTPSQL